MKKAFAIMMVLFVGTICVFAAYGVDYYIENYDVEIVVGNDAVHYITETIDVYFEGPHHGIVREIPIDYSEYNGMKVRVRDLSCSDPYETNEDNGYLVMQIGSSSKTYKGAKRYEISYSYDVGADTFDDYDEFYMNVIGHDWECEIKHATFAVYLPYVESDTFTDLNAFGDWVYDYTWFTTGRYGNGYADKTEVNLDQFEEEGGWLLWKGESYGLGPYEGVTLRTELPEGWYQGARQRWDYRGIMSIISPVVTIVLVALAMLVWATYGKDSIPIIVARFSAPDDMSPLMVGYVADSSVDDKDVISMLFYWADQGLLTIEEKKGDKYEFTKLMDIMDYAVKSGKNIPMHEIKLFNGFFKGCEVGDTMTFSKLEKNGFYDTIVDTKLKTRLFFRKDKALLDRKSIGFSVLFALLSFVPLVLGTLRIGLYEFAPDVVFFAFAVSLFVFLINLVLFDQLFKRWYLRKSNVLMSIVCAIPTLLMAAVFIGVEGDITGTANFSQCLVPALGSALMAFFGIIIEKRSAYGDKVLEQILGYREFIDKVEIDKLKMLIDEDPSLYFHVLSYAVVLGLEDKWAKKFDGMIVPQPSWYRGYNAFDVYYMSRMANRMYHTIPAASIPKSSASGSAGSRAGGSGFHSSGFSGGGFGGGGGHAW